MFENIRVQSKQKLFSRRRADASRIGQKTAYVDTKNEELEITPLSSWRGACVKKRKEKKQISDTEATFEGGEEPLIPSR
jgi:hypothetical protein